MPGEEPVRRPLADSGQCGQRTLHLVVGERLETGEVEVAPGEADGVVGLPAREADLEELVRLSERDPVAGRKRVGVLGADSEALDETVPDRETPRAGTPAGP